MNKERRKAIEALIERVDALRGEIDTLASDIGEVASEERDYYDNMPENFQSSDRGQAAEAAADALDEAQSMCESIAFDEVIDSLNQAMEG